MKSNNKPDSLVATCFGMVASFLIIAALSGCGGGAGSGGVDPNSNNNNGGGGSNNAPDFANATSSPDGNTFTISSFKSGLGDFSLIENANPATAAASANATATAVTGHSTEGTQSVDVNFISQAANLIGLMIDNSGLSDWTPYRYASFDVTTGASAFDGMVVVQSGGWNLTCEASGAVPANNTGTVTLDMDTCGANIDKTAVKRLQLRFSATTAAGHFYIDNVRLQKGAPTPIAPDIADATTSPNGNTFTITSFKTGLSGFIAVDDKGNNALAANATASLDTSSKGAEGTNSANLTVTALPTAGADPWIGLSSKSNGGMADWTPYRYLKFEVATGATAFGGMPAIKSAGWTWCGGNWVDIPANSTGTVTVDLAAPLDPNTCKARDLAGVQEFLFFTKTTGTFYIDNVRLEKGAAPVPVTSATDAADGTAATSAGVTTTLLASFQNGVGALGVYDVNGVASGTLATVTLERPSAAATEGNSAAVVAMTQTGTGTPDALVGGVASVTDWTGVQNLLVDMQATGGVTSVRLVTKSGAGYDWCEMAQSASLAANTTGTITFALSGLTCASGKTFTPSQVREYYLLVQGASGTYRIDNVRLQATAVPPTPASNVLTLADFESGLGSFVGMDDWGGSARATGSVALDTVAVNASQGVQSASATVSSVTAGGKYGVGATGNGGVADWSAYRFLKADITTTTGSFNGVVGASFGASYKPCASSYTWINAGTSSVTLVADLSKCGLTAADIALVQRFQVYSDQVGTFNVDNIRLEKEGTDTADATASADGNTLTISSFAGGVGSFSLIENTSGAPITPAPSGYGTATVDAVAADAAQGTHSVDVNFIAAPSTPGNTLGFTLDGNGGLADWTPYRYLRFDVTAGVSAFDGEVVVQSGGWAFYCNAAGKVEANHVGTVTLDLNWCVSQSKIDKAAVQRLQLRINNTTAAGHFYIDNVRLTKN